MLSGMGFTLVLMRFNAARYLPGGSGYLASRLGMRHDDSFLSYSQILCQAFENYGFRGILAANAGMALVGLCLMLAADWLARTVGDGLPRALVYIGAAVFCALKFDAFYPFEPKNLAKAVFVPFWFIYGSSWTIAYALIMIYESITYAF